MGDRPPLALVTGSAHRLGKALAVGLAQRGYALGLHYHASVDAARQTASEVSALGMPVLMLPADLRQPREIEELFFALQGWDLRILVNCAAEMPRTDLAAASLEDWESAMQLNLRAPWLCSRRAAQSMASGGLIVNITDAAAGKAWRGMNLYLLTKSSLQSLTRLLARNLAPNIRVNAIAPGLILPDADTSSQEWQHLVDRLPLQRQGDPRDLVKALNFLIDNEYITGETITVDGGYQLL